MPFGHNMFADGTVIAFPIEPARAMVGTVEYGWTLGSADGPLTFDELRALRLLNRSSPAIRQSASVPLS